ncbi:MAG: hypothetical protein IK123_05345, partial [Lachnospiraceae bacterium]|nr:hypothetical protein [Lachnospiraceae bacterium]
FEGAWRYDGIDISEVLPATVYTNVNYRYVLATEEPKATMSGWAPYAAAHDTFKKVADNTEAKPDTDYTLYAMNIAANKFYSDVVAVGSFRTKTVPTNLTITAPSESFYIGDATDDYLKTNGTAFTNMTFTFEGNETDERKKLNVDLSNADKNGNYKSRNYNATSKSVETDVIMSDVVVGKIYTYVVLSGNGAVSAADVDKMSQTDLENASATTLGGMRKVDDSDTSTDIKSLSANRYFVRSFFKAFDDTDYNGSYQGALGDGKIDLPYKTASSNTVELVIKQSPIVAVPDVYADVADGTYVKINGSTKGRYDEEYLAYNENTTYGVVSGDSINLRVYAYNTKTGNPMSYWTSGYFNDKSYSYKSELDTNVNGTVTLNKKVINALVPVSPNDAGAIAISTGSLKFANDYVSQNYVMDDGTYLNKEWKLEVEASGTADTYEFGDWAGWAYYGAPLGKIKAVAGYHTHKKNGQVVPSDDDDITDASDDTYINGAAGDWKVLDENK